MVEPSRPIKQAALLLSILVISCLAAFTGCSSVATQKGFYTPITAELRQQKYNDAVTLIEAARDKNKYKEKDRFVYYVDAGLAYHYAERYDTSNIKLTEAEDAADELFTKSISRAAASLMLNDNILEYAGEDYEVLYTNLIKALNYIAEDSFDDAFVEIKRANLKLEMLEQKYRDVSASMNSAEKDDSSRVDINYEAGKVRFNNDAFARYLSMHVYAAEGKLDDAQLDHDFMRRAYIEQKDVYPFPMPDVKYSSRDKAILSVVALQGLSPVKEDLSLRLRTDKDLNLVQILYDEPDNTAVYGHIPMKVSEDYYFKFAIPKLAPRPSVIHSAEVFINDEPAGQLQLLEDVGLVANETFNAKKNLIYLRTVARAVVKGLAAHKAKENNDTGGADGWLKKFAIDVVTDFSENADLRCSRLLPGKILVSDLELEPGSYNIRVLFRDVNGNPVSETNYTNYKVLRDGLNMVEAVALN